jgi:hypothetical protein
MTDHLTGDGLVHLLGPIAEADTADQTEHETLRWPTEPPERSRKTGLITGSAGCLSWSSRSHSIPTDGEGAAERPRLHGPLAHLKENVTYICKNTVPCGAYIGCKHPYSASLAKETIFIPDSRIASVRVMINIGGYTLRDQIAALGNPCGELPLNGASRYVQSMSR